MPNGSCPIVCWRSSANYSPCPVECARVGGLGWSTLSLPALVRHHQSFCCTTRLLFISLFRSLGSRHNLKELPGFFKGTIIIELIHSVYSRTSLIFPSSTSLFNSALLTATWRGGCWTGLQSSFDWISVIRSTRQSSCSFKLVRVFLQQVLFGCR